MATPIAMMDAHQLAQLKLTGVELLELQEVLVLAVTFVEMVK